MPPTRQNTKQIPIPIPSLPSGNQPFKFPDNCHLVITTPRHVFAWDKSGVHSLFRSRRSSIVAAREAKDGSGLLAVASRNVVVLHDTKRGKDESWGLNANQEEVRHLEFSHDAKSLFLTTTSDGTVQRYDTGSSRLLDPAEKLATAPVALAVSPTGHIVLSASHDPPVVYLKNLAHNTVSSLLHPNASAAPVSCAVFHPERPNIFLLAFKDGTVAAYDATKVPKGGPDQTSARDGEISHLQNLHRAVVTGDLSLDKSTLAAPIAGAAFLPGYKTRAVTAGRDGKCKIVDFANKGVILRSWHAKAPLTSISVFAVKPENGRSTRSSRHSQASSSHTIGGPTTTDSLIALGRVDGKVHIYDTVGILLAQRVVSAQEEKIISVEWAKGNTPRALDLGGIERHFSDSMSTSLRPTAAKSATASQPDYGSKKQSVSSSLRPAAARLSTQPQPDPGPTKQFVSAQRTPTDFSMPRTATQSSAAGSAPVRRFTLHPDELGEREDGTVRHIPPPQLLLPTARAPPTASRYDDLFSPVKSSTDTKQKSPRQRITSPGRDRPRISSQTFVKSPKVQIEPMTSAVEISRNVPLFPTAESHATSSGSAERRMQKKPTVAVKSRRREKSKVSPGSVHPISFAQPALQVGDGTISRNSTAVQLSSFNAKVLSDLRKLNGNKITSQHGHGTLSAYTDAQRIGPAAEPSLLTSLATQRREQFAHVKKRSVHLSDSETWPTDSAASLIVGAEDDIWLTSDPEEGTNQQRKRRDERQPRPPARQTSRSQVDDRGTMSTAVLASTASTQEPVSHHVRHVDGSTEEAMLSAATHLSPARQLSPASEDLRKLFPRSSSISPRKSRGPKKKTTEPPERRGLGLTAMSLNEALGRPTKSPWARAKAGRRVASPRKTTLVAHKNHSVVALEDQQVATLDALVRSPSYQCLICPETAARVQTLENEVALMKGEILAMKALLRRNGLPFPACLR